MKQLTLGTGGLLAALILVLAPAARTEEAKKPTGTTFEVADLKFQAPADWKKVEPRSSMRKAQFSVAGEKGSEPAEVVFFYFGPGQGGGAKANVDRWLKQFQEPREKLNAESKTVDLKESEAKITFVSAKGTYLSGPPFGQKTPKRGFMMRAAIVESKGKAVFIKMTGPEKTVVSAQKALDALAQSPFVRKKSGA